MRRFTIEVGETDLGFWECNVIDEYGRETEGLCFGELLEQITSLCHRRLGTPAYQMQKPEEWATWRKRSTHPLWGDHAR